MVNIAKTVRDRYREDYMKYNYMRNTKIWKNILGVPFETWQSIDTFGVTGNCSL